MFSILSRFLPYAASEPEQEHDTPLHQEQNEEQNADAPSDDEEMLPLPVQNQAINMARKPSSFTMDRSRGPPHIAWLTTTPSNSSPAPSRRSWPPKRNNGGSSTPLSVDSAESGVPSGTATNTIPGPQQSLHRMSSDSYHLQSLYYLSDMISENEGAAAAPSKPALSPIGERVEFPPARRPSTDSVLRSPSDGHVPPTPATPATTSSHTAFLNRPLNRTISQTSTSTLGTAPSIAAPTIPPLDLRPNFSGSLGLTPRRSQLPAPSLPTVIGSPRPQVSVIYEDSDVGDAESFRTARSSRSSFDADLERGEDAPLEDQESDVGLEHDDDEDEDDDPFADPEEYHPSTLAPTEGTYESHMSLSPDLYDEIDLGVAELPSPTPLSHAQPLSAASSVLGTIPRRSLDAASTATAVESAIAQRWRKGLSYGSYRTVRAAWRPHAPAALTSACVLFWLGFVAPWCWLIGGWYVSLRWETGIRRRAKWPWVRRNATTVPVEKISRRKRCLSLFLRTRHEQRKEETVPMTPIDSSQSVHELPLALRESYALRRSDPWVRRCKMAAITSGVLLSIAVIIAVVFLAGVRA